MKFIGLIFLIIPVRVASTREETVRFEHEAKSEPGGVRGRMKNIERDTRGLQSQYYSHAGGAYTNSGYGNNRYTSSGHGYIQSGSGYGYDSAGNGYTSGGYANSKGGVWWQWL